jgi:hypothetical protein
MQGFLMVSMILVGIQTQPPQNILCVNSDCVVEQAMINGINQGRNDLVPFDQIVILNQRN